MQIHEVIKHLESYDPDMHVVFDMWQPDDFLGQDASLTEEQVNDAIGLVEKRKDANYGINWDVLDYAIEVVKSES